MSSTTTPKASTSGTQNTNVSISQYLDSLATSSPSSSRSNNKSPKRKARDAMLEYYLAESPRDGANMYDRCHSGYHPSSSSSSQSLSSAISARKQESTTRASKILNAFDTAFYEN